MHLSAKRSRWLCPSCQLSRTAISESPSVSELFRHISTWLSMLLSLISHVSQCIGLTYPSCVTPPTRSQDKIISHQMLRNSQGHVWIWKEILKRFSQFVLWTCCYFLIQNKKKDAKMQKWRTTYLQPFNFNALVLIWEGNLGAVLVFTELIHPKLELSTQVNFIR